MVWNPDDDDRWATLVQMFSHAPFPTEIKQQILCNTVQASLDEMLIIADVLTLPRARNLVVDIMGGAHVRIADQGERYQFWKGLESKDGRHTRHPHDDAAYQVEGRLCHAILFSKFGAFTWLQLEGHPWRWGSIWAHLKDWRNYQSTGRNQGPYGSSDYTDQFPLILIPDC
jgi:hypothetical protein